MQVNAAYIFVVLVWSTTPLAIHLSNSSLTFVTAITLRMALAFICCYTLLRLMGQKLIQQRSDLLLFAYSALGLFPNMLLVYWAAQYIPSGLMSVMLGVYPFFVGIFSVLILKDSFPAYKAFALLIAMVGLAQIHFGQLDVGKNAVWGVIAMLAACIIWGFSSVMVKKLGTDMGALRLGTGSVSMSLPLFLISWFYLDGQVPHFVDTQSIWGVVYLVVVGSVVGHSLWFYVLRQCSVGSVAIIPLLTPVLAITWGVLFAEESLRTSTVGGAVTILLALALYQGIFIRFWSWWQGRLLRYPTLLKLFANKKSADQKFE